MVLPKEVFNLSEGREIIKETQEHNESCYRVEFVGDTATILYLGSAVISSEFGTMETSMPIADMPDWMTRRVAVLCTKSYEPPTESVTNVGRRIAEYIYWVFYKGEEDGDDTREES